MQHLCGDLIADGPPSVFAYPGLRNAIEIYRYVGLVQGIAYSGSLTFSLFGSGWDREIAYLCRILFAICGVIGDDYVTRSGLG